MRRLFLLVATFLAALVESASAQQPSRALVYCPVSIDATGCNAIVTALTGSFAVVERGYDGSSGTVDLATADLNHYAVFVVPSLADGPGAEPYALLRSAAVASRLEEVIVGRAAIWSGTPDQGAASRDAKNILLRSLARWVAGGRFTGLVVLQDHSADEAQRYGWIRGISPAAVGANLDPGFASYGAVQANPGHGVDILRNGAEGPVPAYDNMASVGLQIPTGANRMTIAATGGTENGRAVLATYEGERDPSTRIQTDVASYTPGTPVRISGSGWVGGEVVRLVLHEDPFTHANRLITVTADAAGNIATEITPEQHDTGVDFVITARGEPSGRLAQTAFTTSARNGPVEFYFQAHQDDWQLFFGDRSAASVKTARKVVFVYTTAGDAGSTPDYWQAREAGAKASVDAISVADAWSCAPRTIEQHPIHRCAKANTVSYFLRLPDGNGEGQGYNGRASLAHLRGSGRDVSAVDNSTTYTTWDDLIATVRGIIAEETAGQSDAETIVHSQDWEVLVNGGDHSDHIATGDLARAAAANRAWNLFWYMGYQNVFENTNLSATAHAVKWRTIVAYDDLLKGNYGSILGQRAEEWAARTIFRSEPSGSAWTYAPLAGLIATPFDATRIDLVWDAFPGAEGYRVERAPDIGGYAGQYSINATLPAGIRSWSSEGLQAETRYWYRVRAFSGPRSSAYSPEIVAATRGSCTAPAFTSHPASATGTIGQSVTFSVAASGVGAPTYQWRRNGEDIPGATSSTYQIASITGEDAGSYDAVATNGCGSVTSTAATLTINKAAATVSLSDLTHTFDGTVKTPTVATAPADFGVAVTYTDPTTGVTGSTPPVNAGRYGVTATVTDPNYEGSTTGTLTILAATPTITWAPPASISHGTPLGGAQLTAAAIGVDGEAVNGTFSYAPGAGAVLAAGTHSLTATFASADANYGPAAATVPLQVTRAVAAFAGLSSATVSYGANSVGLSGSLASSIGSPSGSVAITLGMGEFARQQIVALQANGSFTASFSTLDLPASATPYPITYSYEGDANFDAATDNSTGLTVEKATATVTLNGLNHTYDGTAKSAVVTTSPAALTGVEISYNGANPRAAGSYTVAVTLDNQNYRLAGGLPVTGTLVIAKARLAASATDASREYGDANPAFTGSVTGIVAGDAITASFTSAANAASAVGSYPIVVELADPQGALANYDVVSDNGTLTVTRARLTLTATSHEKRYGAVFTGGTSSVVGLKNGDAITASQTSDGAPADAPAGPYAITPIALGDAATLRNYDITPVLGTLRVTPAQLTVTAASHSKQYNGQPFTAFDAAYEGFVLGQGPSVLAGTLTFGGTAVGAVNVGSYTIVPAGVSSANYAIGFAEGSLTIAPASLRIEAGSAERLYGDANPGFNGTLAGAIAADGITATFAAAADERSAIGTYPIVPAAVDPQGKLGNYAVTLVSGTLRIMAASLTVRPNGGTRVYGDANPTLTGNIQGLKNGDAIAAMYATTATPASAVGSYPITATLVDAAPSRLGNYDVTLETGTLTIEAAPLTITANPKSRAYGESNPIFDGAISGIRNDDPISASYATVATVTTVVGSYPIMPTPVDPNGRLTNYTVTANAGTLTIDPSALTVTVGNTTKIYGTEVTAFSGSVTGVRNGDAVTARYTSEGAAAAADVGAYAITATVEGDAAVLRNYTFAPTQGTLRVNPAALTVTAENKAKQYDGQPFTSFTAGYAGFVLGQNPGALGGTLAFGGTAAGATAAGTYDIVPGGLTSTNYTIGFVSGTLRIGKPALHIEVTDLTREYGEPNPLLTGTVTGLVAADGITVTYVTSANAGSSVGSYAITPQVADPQQKLANYDITTAQGSLTVTPALLSVTPTSTERRYGSANPDLTGSVRGQKNGDVITATYSTTATQSSSVGAYEITASLSAAPGILGNYTVSPTVGTLTVTPAPLTITADDASKVYGSANPVFTARYAGFVLGEDAPALAGTLSFGTSAATESDAGTYSITPSGLTSTNYDVTFTQGTLTVRRAALTVTAEHKAKQYDGETFTAFTARYDGFVLGQGPSVLGGTLAFGGSAVGAVTAGSYTILPTGLTSGNYDLAFVAGRLEIGKATLMVTAADATREYGLANPTFGGEVTGIAAGMEVTYTTTANAGSAVGSYAIVPAVNDPQNRLASYDVTLTNGTMTVTKARLTVTSAAAERVYGSANPAFSGTVAGLRNGDAVGATYSTVATAASPAGRYEIAAELNAAAATLDNYDVIRNMGMLTVNRAALTVRADDKSRIYGAANPSFTASYSGLVLGQEATVLDGVLAFTTSAAATSAVGSYTITPSGVSSANYAITFAAGTLSITPAPATVTVTDASVVYGAATPTFTTAVTGLVAGDALTCTTTVATTLTAAGTYPVTVECPESPNYTVSTVPGTLVVEKATLTVTASDASRMYGAANPPLTGTITGFVLGDGVSVLTAQPSYGTSATISSGVGSYPITAGGAAAANYEFQYVSGSLTVTAAPLTAAVGSAERMYGAANPSFTGTITGLVNGDVITASYSTTATAASSVGTYPITQTLVDPTNALLNYDVTRSNGTLTVTQAPLAVRADDQRRQFGAANPVLTGTITGIVNGDAVTATYTTPATAVSPAGQYPITPTVSAPGNTLGNYAVTTTAGTLFVDPAPAVVTWATPAAIAFGTPLGATQLNATASTSGSFSYSPGAGTVLGVGTHTLSVTFTPADGNAPVSQTTTLVVTKATPTIVWAPTDVTIPTGLGAAQLNAVAYGSNGTTPVPGTYAYSTNGTTVTTGTVLQPGINTPLTVVFTPTGAEAVNYGTATMTVTTFNVLNKIDITPGSTSNAISLGGTQAEVMVGILSTAAFDARTVVLSGTTAPTLGNGTGVETALAKKADGTPKTALTDFNADGRWDVMLYFPKAALISNGDVTSTTTQLILQGQLTNGRRIKGVDKVTVTP